jgi:plasmid rolling circle replication initiator protein Rep
MDAEAEVHPHLEKKVKPKILEHIEKIRRHYMWNKKAEEVHKCNSLVAWTKFFDQKIKLALGFEP